jgi:hypothetical protein
VRHQKRRCVAAGVTGSCTESEQCAREKIRHSMKVCAANKTLHPKLGPKPREMLTDTQTYHADGVHNVNRDAAEGIMLGCELAAAALFALR